MALSWSLVFRKGSLSPPLFRKPSQMNNDPSCVPSFHQIPTVTLSLSKLSACQAWQHSCILFQVWLDFKAPYFRDPAAWTQADLLEEGFAALWLITACPRKWSCDCTGSEFRKNHNTQMITVCWPQPVSLFLCWWMGQFNGSHSVFCLQSGQITSTKCIPSRGSTSSPCNPGDSQTVAAHSQSTTQFTGLILEMVLTSETSDSKLHYL